MEIQEEHNFNLPLVVKELFKFQREIKTGEMTTNDQGDVVPETETLSKEYTRPTYLLWENIDGISGYPYEDTWDNEGEKFFIEYHNRQILVLGKIDQIVELWTEFRALHGPYIQHIPIDVVYTMRKAKDNGGEE